MNDGIITDDTKLTLASSSTEAVSTYVSKQIRTDQGDALQEDEQLRLENQLEAVMLSDSVQGKNVDFVNRLKSDRHKQSFSQVDGGTLWAFIEESKISITQQMLVPDAYDSVSKTLHIAGKKWTLTMAKGHENDLDNHTLDLAYSLSDGTTPTVRVVDNELIVELGDTSSPTTVGQLRAALEDNPAFERVESTDNQDAELIGNCYDAMNKILYVSGKKFLFCLLYTSPSPRDLSTSRMPSSA